MRKSACSACLLCRCANVCYPSASCLEVQADVSDAGLVAGQREGIHLLHPNERLHKNREPSAGSGSLQPTPARMQNAAGTRLGNPTQLGPPAPSPTRCGGAVHPTAALPSPDHSVAFDIGDPLASRAGPAASRQGNQQLLPAKSGESTGAGHTCTQPLAFTTAHVPPSWAHLHPAPLLGGRRVVVHRNG